MAEPNPIEAITRAAEILGEADDPLALWVAGRLSVFLGGHDLTLDQALGLATSQSQRSWRTREMQRRRDAALAALMREFPDETPKTIAESLKRYADGSFPADARAKRRPAALRGRLFDILEHGGPLGARRIRQLLAEMSKPCSFPSGTSSVDSETGER